MLQQLTNASINNLNSSVSRAQKAMRDIFHAKSITLANRLQKFFQHEDSTLSNSVDDAAPHVVLSSQGDIASCQAIVWDRLEQFAVQRGAGNFQNDPASSQESSLSINWKCRPWAVR